MTTVACPDCGVSRAVSRSMACMIRKSHSTGRCRPCATAIRVAAQRAAAVANLHHRFWSKVDKTGGCWLWQARRDAKGYGTFQRSHGNNAKAHRVAWALTNGQIPEGLHVCHHCDTPACVRPEHLSLGTASDNMRDMVAKGRHAGGRRAMRKLNADAIERNAA